MKYVTHVMSNPGDFIKDGYLGKPMFADQPGGPAVARHLHSVAPSKFDGDGIPVCWAVTVCSVDAPK